MRADGAAAIASTVLGALLAAGCRTADVNGKVHPDPELQAIVRSAEAAEIAALPEGSAKTLVTDRCLLCHGAALIVQQRKDAAAWGRTVAQMRTWAPRSRMRIRPRWLRISPGILVRGACRSNGERLDQTL
jgi:cytochrome c5